MGREGGRTVMITVNIKIESFFLEGEANALDVLLEVGNKFLEN